MGGESQETRVAIATNDIEWLKESQRSTNRGIEQLQLTLTQHMKEQNERSEKFVTKEELKNEVGPIKADIEKIKMRIYVFSGIVICLMVFIEYGRQWLGVTGH